MTDARLPGPWLFRGDLEELSDREWRTYVSSLMWSNEAGTDGQLPPRAHKFLHPEGVSADVAAALVAAGLWSHGAAGYSVPDWTGGAGQETAAAVESRRLGNRRRQAAHRQAKAGKPADASSSVTRDVTRDVTADPVGQDRTGQALSSRRKFSGTSAEAVVELFPADGGRP